MGIDIKQVIDDDCIKKIFGNMSNIKNYLQKLGYENKYLNKSTRNQLYNIVKESWNYEISSKIIRDMFKATTKYKNGKASERIIEELLKEWKELDIGDLSWPFSQGQFDNYVQGVNAENINRAKKDSKVKKSALKYRRIKELNTARNDFLETLIFETNENIIPTLSHSRGVDFFINGISYDQKVAGSPTKEFKADFSDNWKQEAIDNPSLVAKYLYKYQDEGRFDYLPRLYVVYLDESVSASDIKDKILNANLDNPYKISFTYNHELIGVKQYESEAYVILLYSS